METKNQGAASANNTVRIPIILLGVTILALMFLRLSSPPISYLHSWNQISTLATIRGLHHEKITVLTPKDVVTRIEWSGADDHISEWEKDPRFTIYEEFPLYHLLVSKVGNILPSLEMSGHLVSIFFFWLFLAGTYFVSRITFDERVGQYAAVLSLTSSSLLYYGQAIMSDIAMAALYTWSLYFLVCFEKQDWKLRALFLSALTLLFAGLFKSYAVVGVIPHLTVVACHRRAALPVRLFHSFILLLATAPPLVWHAYALLYGEGVSETGSHALQHKVGMILSFEFLESIFSHFSKLVGIASVIAILALFLWRAVRRERLPALPLWAYSGLFVSILFLFATADKVPFHDYYFLVVAPLLIPNAARFLVEFFDSLQGRFSVRVSMSILLLGLAVNSAIALKRFFKATDVNPDVLACAEFVKTRIPEGELIAVASDGHRFNSIHYYSERNGFVIPGEEYPLERYKRAGVHSVVVNHSPEFAAAKKRWLEGQGAIATPNSLAMFSDRKGKDRSCYLFSLRAVALSPRGEERLQDSGPPANFKD